MRTRRKLGELYARAAAPVMFVAAFGACDSEAGAVVDPLAGSTLEAVSPLEWAGTVGSVAPSAPTVRLLNSGGAPVAGVVVFFMPVHGSGSVAIASARTAADGTASAGAWTLGTRPGGQVLHATSASLPRVTFTATAAPGPPARMVLVGGDRQVAPAGTTLQTLVEVRVLDAYDNDIPDAAITYTVIEGNGRVEPMSDASGVNAGRWTLEMPGLNRLRVEAGSAHTIVHAFGCEEDAGGGACGGNFGLVSGMFNASGTLQLLPGGRFWTRHDTITGSGRFSVSGSTIHLDYDDDYLTRLSHSHNLWPLPNSSVSESGVISNGEISFRRCYMDEWCFDGTWVYRLQIAWPEQ